MTGPIKCLRCGSVPDHPNDMRRCFCVSPWLADEETLYPDFSRYQLEEELLKAQSALFLAAQLHIGATGPADYPKIVQLISRWGRQAEPLAEQSRARKLERNQLPSGPLQ